MYLQFILSIHFKIIHKKVTVKCYIDISDYEMKFYQKCLVYSYQNNLFL